MKTRWTTFLGMSALALMLIAGCDQKTSEQTAKANPVDDSAKKGAAISADGPAKKKEEAKKAEEPKKMEEEVAAKAAIGKPAPDFTLTDQDGTEHKLSQYKGKIVVLEWTRSACPYVVRHYKKKTMVTTHEKLGKEVVWLAVDSSKSVKAEDVQAWRKEYGFNHNVLIDPSGATGKLYGAKTTPHMFVIDTKGMLRYSGAIDDDKSDEKDQDVNYVLEAVNAVKAGKDVGKAETQPYGCTVKYAS